MGFQEHGPFPKKLSWLLLQRQLCTGHTPQCTSHFSAHTKPPSQAGRGQAPDALNAALCFLMQHFTAKNKPAPNKSLVCRYCTSYLFHPLQPSSMLQEWSHLERERFTGVKKCKGKLKREGKHSGTSPPRWLGPLSWIPMKSITDSPVSHPSPLHKAPTGLRAQRQCRHCHKYTGHKQTEREAHRQTSPYWDWTQP